MKKKISIIFILVLTVLFGWNYYNTIKGKSMVGAEVTPNDDISEVNIEHSNRKEEVVEYIQLQSNEVNIPILMYHSISDADSNNNLLMPPAMFKEQMIWLKSNNFTAMTLGEAVTSMETGKVPKRPVILTFDDGYVDNYTVAYPILKESGLKGTFFIITSMIDTSTSYMNSDMLKEMSNNGMSIENHTHHHFDLPTGSIENQKATIKKGQEILKEKVGVESKFLCYPTGKYTKDTISVLDNLGVKAAVTTKGGIAHIGNGLYELRRVRMSPMNIEAFSSIFTSYMN